MDLSGHLRGSSSTTPSLTSETQSSRFTSSSCPQPLCTEVVGHQGALWARSRPGLREPGARVRFQDRRWFRAQEAGWGEQGDGRHRYCPPSRGTPPGVRQEPQRNTEPAPIPCPTPPSSEPASPSPVRGRGHRKISSPSSVLLPATEVHTPEHVHTDRLPRTEITHVLAHTHARLVHTPPHPRPLSRTHSRSRTSVLGDRTLAGDSEAVRQARVLSLVPLVVAPGLGPPFPGAGGRRTEVTCPPSAGTSASR